MVDLVHQLSGKHIVYVLQCEPLDGKETRYVGSSTSIERRTSEHLGLADRLTSKAIIDADDDAPHVTTSREL